MKKGQKQGNLGSLCSFFSISFFHAVAQEHCMFCGGAFCAWRRIASLVFCSAHVFVCWESDALVLSLCANDTRRNEPTVQGRLINDGTLCYGCRTGRAHFLCAPWEHASIVCGICKVCIGLLFVNHNQAKQKKPSKLQAAGWVMPPV